MEKVTEVVYIANDGQRFQSEEECRKHEGLLAPSGLSLVLDYAETISPSAARRFATALIQEYRRNHSISALKTLREEFEKRREVSTGALYEAYDNKVYICNLAINEIKRGVA